MQRSEFVTHVLDQLRALGPVTARAMFGGWGIYSRDLIIGLVVDDVLHLKVDDANRGAFEAAGSRPVHLRRSGRSRATVMSYWQVPSAVLDDADELVAWSRDALAAARRARSVSSRRSPRGARGGTAGRRRAPRSRCARLNQSCRSNSQVKPMPPCISTDRRAVRL